MGKKQYIGKRKRVYHYGIMGGVTVYTERPRRRFDNGASSMDFVRFAVSSRECYARLLAEKSGAVEG